MTTLKATITWARDHAVWIALAALPLILAACNGGGSSPGGAGY